MPLAGSQADVVTQGFDANGNIITQGYTQGTGGGGGGSYTNTLTPWLDTLGTTVDPSLDANYRTRADDFFKRTMHWTRS